MDADEVWRTIDRERGELADVLDTFTETEWETPSLCAGWRVRDVAAHLTLAQMRLREGIGPALRARGGFNKMIYQTAIWQAELPVEEYAPRIRAMVGSRRKAPFISDREPMLDVLVHAQDMLVPLGRTREMPREAAAVSAQRAWGMSWPFRVRKRLHGFRLVASDHPWSAGEGQVVEGRMQDLLMLVTGRDVVLPELTGGGADGLRRRLQPVSA